MQFLKIIDERSKHSEKNIGQELYDPDKNARRPLKEAHQSK